MKDIFNHGIKLYGKIVIATIMCFFIVISVAVITTAFFTENIGYTAFGTKEDSDEAKLLYTYYFKDGEDTQKEVFEKQGYTITTSNLKSQVKKSIKLPFDVLTQIILISMLTTFIYPSCWQMGTNDNNLVQFGHKQKDLFFGFKIGFVAVIVPILFLLIVYFAKLGISTALFAFLNSQYYVIFNAIFGGVSHISNLSAIKLIGAILVFLYVPFVSGISYYLGFKNFSFAEKLMYKKKTN